MTSNNLGLSFDDLVGPFDSQLLNMNSKIGDQLLSNQKIFNELQQIIHDQQFRIHRLETPFRILKNLWRQFTYIGPKIKQRLIHTQQLVQGVLILIIRNLGLYEQAFAFKHRRLNRIKLKNLSPWAKQIYDDLRLAKKINSKQDKP